jgi:hypothetical protein
VVTRRRAASALLVMALCTSSLATHAQADAAALRGAQLYDGRLPLAGQLRGHSDGLPAQALRCSNCHEPSSAPVTNSSFAPRLDSRSLTQFQARRGAPQTRYDADSFCRVLRSSVDPGLVLLRKPMPQYSVTDDDCQALWLFLSQRPAALATTP